MQVTKDMSRWVGRVAGCQGWTRGRAGSPRPHQKKAEGLLCSDPKGPRAVLPLPRVPEKLQIP